MEIRNVKKAFASNQVLKGLNLSVTSGQRVALIGQNGSGKTTLIRCLLGLYHFEGDIDIFGTSIKLKREEALKKIAFVPQLPPALKNTVEEIISLSANLCDFSQAKVYPLANELGLDISRCLHTPFKSLSGGMKQKLLIALALAREPNLLIMDEPSANLDPQARAIFFNLLSKLPEKTTMLLTSHRVDELAGIVTRVIELDGGKIAIDDIVESHDKKILTEQQDCLITFRRIPDSVKVILRQWHFSPCDPEEFKWGGDISSADSFRFYATLTRWSGMIQEISLKTKDKV